MPRDICTVAVLINTLKTFPSDATVMVASDEEGNSYGDLGIYAPEDGVDGRKVVTFFPLGYLDDEQVFAS